jgi:hypothetical protein
MPPEIQPVDKRFSTVLFDIARTIDPQGLTLRELLERFGERGLLMLCIVLTIPFLLPASIPGSSIPFGLVIALNGIGVLTHRSPWLPARLMNRRLDAKHLIVVLEKAGRLFARLEGLMHPRLLILTHRGTIGRFNGILLVLSGILLMAPLPLPFSNTLPAYAALFLSAGSLERDGYLILAGYLMVLLTIAYFGGLAVFGGVGARALWSYL